MGLVMKNLTRKYVPLKIEKSCKHFVCAYDKLNFEEKHAIDSLVARLKARCIKMRDADALELIGKLGIYIVSKGIIEL